MKVTGREGRGGNFFSECVAGNKERTVVIISDAMRYEVGAELAALLAGLMVARWMGGLGEPVATTSKG